MQAQPQAVENQIVELFRQLQLSDRLALIDLLRSLLDEPHPECKANLEVQDYLRKINQLF